MILRVNPRKGLAKNVDVPISRLYVLNSDRTHPEQTTDQMDRTSMGFLLAVLKGSYIKALISWLSSMTLMRAQYIPGATNDKTAFTNGAPLDLHPQPHLTTTRRIPSCSRGSQQLPPKVSVIPERLYRRYLRQPTPPLIPGPIPVYNK